MSTGARLFEFEFELVLLRPLFWLRVPEFVLGFELVVPRLALAAPLFALRLLALRLFALFAFELRFTLLLLALPLLLLFEFLFRVFLFALFEFSFSFFEEEDSVFVFFSSAATFSSEELGTDSSPSFADARLTTTATV